MTASTAPATVITRRNVWQSIWHLVTSDALTATLILALVGLLTIAALLPQTPHGDVAAYSRWLSDIQTRYGGAANAMTALGLFDAVHALAFRALAAALGIALTARLADCIHAFRAGAQLDSLPDAARSIDLQLPLDEIAGRLRRYRIRKAEAFTLADRYPWAHLAAIAAHLGPIVALIGLALSPLADWRVDALSALPGATTPIPNTAYALQTSGVGDDGQVDFTLLRNDEPIGSGSAAPGRPSFGNEVSLYVRQHLPALRVSGSQADGRALKLQSSAQGEAAGELLLTFDADRRDAFFAVPEAQLAVRLSIEELNRSPAYRLSAFSSRDAALLAQQTIQPGEPFSIGENHFRLDRASHAIVSAVHAPMQAVVIAGAIVAIAGLAATTLYPAHRVWLTPGENGARAVCDDPDLDLARLLSGKA